MTAKKMPPPKVVRVVERARHILGRLHQRSAPPAAAMLDKIFGAWIAQGIAVAADLKVADALQGVRSPSTNCPSRRRRP